MQEVQKKPIFRQLSIIICFIQFPLAILVALTYRSHNAAVMDFSGLAFGIMILIGGCVIGIICSIASMINKEKSTTGFVASFTCQLIVILILIVSFLAYMNRAQTDRKKIEASISKSNKQKTLVDQIRSDPSIVLREHWHKSSDPTTQQALMASFKDADVNYTLEMLQSIYDDSPTIIKGSIFSHPSCSKSFISTHFKEAYTLCEEKTNCDMLAQMMGNPNTPIDLIEKVAEAKKLAVWAVNPARSALKKRRPNQP